MQTVRRRWTVTTWNVRGTAEPPLDHVAAVLRDTEADVVVLQEVQRAQARDLAARLGMHRAWALKHHPRTPFMWWQAEGLAILTPHVLRDPGSATLTPDRSTWTWRRRIVQWAVVERADHAAHRIVNLHLTPHDAPEQRRAEVRRVVEMFPADAGPPLVLCGDLNDDGEPGVVDALPGLEAVPPRPTSPAEAPVKCLDHVLVPPGATDVHQHVPGGGETWAQLSDHLPVTVSFSLDWVEGDWTAR